MNEYYTISIRIYGCAIDGNEEDYSLFNTREKYFDTLDNVIKYLKSEYDDNIDGVERTLVYVGEGTVVGYCYEFENGDMSHSPVECWKQRDIVEIYKMTSTNVMVSGELHG